jgi:general L-amino acid transport system permease protein
MVATAGIVLSFPFGVLLALGRQSKTMPVVKWFSTIYIEVIRGLPLIGILFVAKTMMPLIVPKQVSDRFDRAGNDRLYCLHRRLSG